MFEVPTRHIFLLRTFLFKWIAGRLGFGNIDYAMNVEGNFLAFRGPMLVAEAVDKFAV